MGRTIEIFKGAGIQIKNALFDLAETYKHGYGWLSSKEYDIVENAYKEKLTAGGKELFIKWTATRDVDDYTQFKLIVEWELYGINDVEAQAGGEKIKMQKGEINVKITAEITVDYNDKWEAKPFLAFLKAFYEKYLYKPTLDKLKSDFWTEGWDFRNEMKAFLNLYQYG